MKKEELREILKDSILLFDGAVGTMLYSRGIYINRCFDELNISKPKLVKEIHDAYRKAKADCLETNTFGANRFKLTAHGFGEKLEEINHRGAQLAKEAAGEELLVAGSIGPLGIRIEPWGPTSVDEAKEAFLEQATALKGGGVDLFILETFSDLSEIRQAIRACQELGDLPVIASMTIGDDGNSLYGTSPEIFAQRLDDWGADVIGINCSVGPRMMMEALEKMVKVTDKPISVMPNAGTPQEVEGRNIYLASAEYMAEYARRFIQAGAKIVGGCCGTTPEYIRAMHNAIRSLVPQQRTVSVVVEKKDVEETEPVLTAEKSRLGKKIACGEFVVTVEIVPPGGCDASGVLEKVKLLKENQVDAVNVPDGPRALSRMGAQQLSLLIYQQVGIEPILHYTCRDRNLLGMVSDMLGLDAVGLKNLLIITGDPPKMGDYPDATAVFDVDSIGLVNIVNYLNRGVDLGGNRIGKPTGYLIGVGVNPGAIELETEIRRFEWKVKAGAEFAITQPVFDVDMLLSFLDKIEHVRIPIIAGIWPLVSLRNAEFMNNEVPGASVPDEIMSRMRAAKTKEDALREGISIARETVLKVRDSVEGIQVSAPFGNVQHALDVISVLQNQ
ncbi:MAG: bifunctional homocysteine S-methyltransferase/methylenetetrahydrofolate reductase [Candidatus Glassbacteria bacterium]